MTTPNTLVLLDVDGVLIHPVGYKDALRATMRTVAALMGQPDPEVTYDEIAVFEACGLTNEWDSGAMCASLLLQAALDRRPDLQRDTLDDTLAAIRAAGITLARPDFAAEARAIADAYVDGRHPSQVYLDMLGARTPATQRALLQALLGDVYDVSGTLTTRIFQTYALGSEQYRKTYGEPVPVETESYISTRDKALLDAASRARLLDWADDPAHGVVVYTARPSLPPADLDSGTAPVHTGTAFAPEAELGLDLLKLAGHVPLMGQGRVGWLAWRNGRMAGEYVKPSPVHALAAIGAAASGLETESLTAAATLVEQDELTGPLAALRGGPVRVIVCEDSTGGIRATRGAITALQRAGVAATLTAVGVSPHPDKRAALGAVADHVADDINAGLAWALGWARSERA